MIVLKFDLIEQSHNLRCTESFMRENVVGEMGQLGPDDETKQKMLDILKRFHSEEEETDDMDDDDNAGRFLFCYYKMVFSCFSMKFMAFEFNDAFGEFSVLGILYVHCKI